MLTRIWKLADICTWTYSLHILFPSLTTLLMWSCALIHRRRGWEAGEGRKTSNKYFLFLKEEAVSLGMWGTFGLIRFLEIAVFGGKQTSLIRDSPSRVIWLSFSIALNTTSLEMRHREGKTPCGAMQFFLAEQAFCTTHKW